MRITELSGIAVNELYSDQLTCTENAKSFEKADEDANIIKMSEEEGLKNLEICHKKRPLCRDLSIFKLKLSFFDTGFFTCQIAQVENPFSAYFTTFIDFN